MLEEVNLNERIVTGQTGKQSFSRKECWLGVENRLRLLAITSGLPQPATLADVKFVCETRHQNPKASWNGIGYAQLIPTCRVVAKLAKGDVVIHHGQNGSVVEKSGADTIKLVLDDARVMTVQGFRKTWSLKSSANPEKAIENAVNKLADQKYATFRRYAKVIAKRGDSTVFLKLLHEAIQPAQRRIKTPKTVKADATTEAPAAPVFSGENRLSELLAPSVS
jgi:hypothetical protein